MMSSRPAQACVFFLLFCLAPCAWAGRPDGLDQQAAGAEVGKRATFKKTKVAKSRASTSPVQYNPATWSWDYYHTMDEIAAYLQALEQLHPNNCKLTTIGKSINGRSIFAMEATTSTKPRSAKPLFMYIGNMHGDEVVNRELLLRLLGVLCEAKDARIKALLDATIVQVIPTMNPDGFSDEPARRYNAAGYDLNRNWMQAMVDDGVYPYPVPTSRQESSSSAATQWASTGKGPLQLENQVIRSWALANAPLLSANLHGGSLVVSLPKDVCDTAGQSIWCPHSEWNLTQALGLAYSSKNARMFATSTEAADGNYVQQGIIQGAYWYPVLGSMADWFMYRLGSMQLTIEMWEAKYPPPKPALANAWDQHQGSLVRLIEMTHMGLAGRVVDAKSGKPLAGNISVTAPASTGTTYPAAINEGGYFWKLLAPGMTYTISIFPADPSDKSVMYKPLRWTGGLPKSVSVKTVMAGSGLTGLAVTKTFKAQRK